MLQPSQDKSKVLYDVVSKDYDIGSYDEFSSKLQNPEKRKAFYEGVGKEYALGSYEEFESKVAPLKKKDKSDVTATPQKLVSETSTGSLDGVGSNGFPAIDKNLGVPGLKPDLKTVEQLANPPKSNTDSTKPIKKFEGLIPDKTKGFYRQGEENVEDKKYIDEGFSNKTEYVAEEGKLVPKTKTTYVSEATKNLKANYAKEIGRKSISEYDPNLTEENLQREKEQSGVLNTLGKVGKYVLNATGESLSAWNEALGGDEGYFTIDQYEPLQDQKKQAKKDLQREGLPITEEAIQKRAEDIFRKEDRIQQIQKRVDANLPEDYDREGIWKELKLDNLKNNDKLRSAVATIDINKKQIDDFNKYAAYVNSLPKEKITQDKVDKYNKLLAEAQDSSESLEYYQKTFPKLLKEVKSSDELLDVMKFNYNDYEKAYSNITGLGKTIAMGSLKLAGETANYTDQILGREGQDTGYRQAIIDVANEELDKNTKDKEQYIRYKAKDINSFSDGGSFMAQLGTEQLPVYATLVLAPEIGLPLLGSGTAGEQFRNMEVEEMQPFAKQTTFGQKLATAYLYGSAETLFERLGTVSVLKNIEKSIARASNASRKLIYEGAAKESTKLAKRLGLNTAIEGGTEYLTAEAQIGADKYVSGKNISSQQANERRFESTVAGGLMGGSMTLMGGVWGSIAQKAKLYSENKDIKETKAILSQIDLLSDELKNNPNLNAEDKKIIYDKMNDLTNKSFDIVIKNSEKGKNFSAKENQFLVDINVKQDQLKQKFEELKNSNISTEQKELLVKDLNNQYAQLEKDRNSTLKGEFETIPDIRKIITFQKKEEDNLKDDQALINKAKPKAEVQKQQSEAEEVNGPPPMPEGFNVVDEEPTNGKEDASSKIRNKELFADGGLFANELGGSGQNSIPTNHSEINGIEFVQYSNPTTGIVDTIMTGTSGSDFVGFYRIYENGKPTNKWSSKFENQSRNKENFKTMISGVQSMLPKNHEYTEKTSISTDGLRVWEQQLSRGYEIQTDENGNIVTNEVAINGDAINNELGIDVNQGNFDNISVNNNQQFESVKKALIPYLKKLGLNENNIKWENGTVIIDLPVLRKTKKENEATPTTNNPVNGNVQSRTSDVGENGIAEQQSPAKESVPSAVDVGKSKSDNEVNLEDIQNFINETYLNDEKSSTTTEADQGAVKNSNEENRAIPIGEKGKKQVKVTKEGKVSLQGRKALAKRQFKGDRKTASEIDPTDATSLALKYFVNGGKIVSDYFASQGERQARSNGLNGIASSKGKTIDVIAHEIWESQENSELKLDTQEIKNAVEEIVNGNLTVQDAVASILGKYNVEEQNDADYEKDYAQAIQEYQQEEDYSQEHIQEVESALDYLSDAEIIELANNQEKEFEDYIKDLESRQVTYDLGPFSEKGTIQPDGSILSENGELLSPESVRNVKQIDTEVKSAEKPKTTISKKSPELIEVNKQLKEALEKEKVAKDALLRKMSKLDNEAIKDNQDLFGKRKSEDANLLFNERVDSNARNKVLEKEKARLNEVREEIKSLKETKAKIESGEINSTKQMVFDEVDRIAQKVKDLLPGIKDADLKKQGISQDDLIDLVASAVKALVSKGIDVNDAIRQVISSIKERFNVDVDEKLVKEKLGVEKPKSNNKNPLREKSSEEISDELGISEKEYLDLKSFVANEPSSGIFNEYLSAETIADVFGDSPTNDQQYEQMVLLNAVQHGNSVLEKARSIFGENYMSKTLEFLQNVKLGNFEKAMVYAALENEIDTLVKANPSNKVFLATQRLIYADSQANLRNSSKGLNAGRLRRIHNAIKNGYDIDKLTSGLIKPEQQEAKQILKDAIPTGDNLNKASEQEENEIDSEERIYTQNELDEAIEKARREFEEENLGFEIRESKVKIKKEDALEQIRKIKENWKKASRDGTLSASLPYAKQVIAVAPDVIQLAKLYSQIAGMKTIDIVQAIKNDVSEVFDLITEKDIKGILKKEYGAKSRKMSEATKRKIYVKLLNKAIESLDAQIQAKKRDVVTRVDKYKNDSEIKELRKKRAEKRNELAIVDPSYAESRKLATDLKLAQKSLDEYQRRIDENELTLSEKDPKIVDEKLKKLRDLRDSKRKEFLKKKKDFEDSLKDPVVPLTKEELADKKYLSDVKSKINSINKRIEELKSNKPKSNDAKSTLWSSEISKLQNELISLTSKREYQEKKIIDRLEKRLEDLKSKKAKDNLGASSVWNQQISDIQNEIKKEKENQKEPKKTKTSDVVRKALIDAGFSREITVTKNAKDENGNDIIENGKKVKIKETKEVLDWNKLTGRMNSVEALRSNVEDKLKEQGYTDLQIQEISNELETEYKRLTEYIADKALTELERRNQIPKPVNRKSDLDRLVDYHNKGLFGESAKGYERLINKIVGITKREQDVLDKIESEIEKIKNLREVKIDGSFPDAQSIESQASYIAKSIRNIIAWANLVNARIDKQAIEVLSDIAGISRAAVLGNLYNAFQNIYSNNRAGYLARKKFELKGYWTKELNDAFNELKRAVTSDVLINRGLDFGGVVSPFSHHSIFIEKLKDYIEKKYPEGRKRRMIIGALNTFEGRLFLNVMDSRFKSKIVNIDFMMNLVDVLTSERAGKSKMTKEEAVNFVSESLTGVNLEKAKVLAKKFINDVNAMKENTLLENEDNIKRLAFDIVRENLTSGNNFTMDEINDIYQASMKSGGANIGHESNNIISESLKNLNNWIEKKVEDAMKEKDYDKATKYATYAFISKNITYPYMSGGFNWAVLEAEAGTPLGLATGAYKSYKNKQLDLLTDVGRKRMKEDLINRRDAESKLFRGIWGTSIGVAAYLAYYGLQAVSGIGDDDEENKRNFNKYLREHPEQRKIFDKFLPEVYAVSLAVSDERLSKYLLNKMGYKTDQNDNVLTLLKSLQNKNSSTAGALGVLLGQIASTPGAWRILRDTKRLFRELQGEPMAQTEQRVTSFLNGYFKGALVDYLGLRPGTNYDLEKVKKEIQNKKTDFTNYTNGIANDINSGKITKEDAAKLVNKKYEGNDELLTKAKEIIQNSVNDKEIREGLKDADIWYMEMYNEKDIRAKAYIYYQNALKNKRETQDKNFYDYMNLALFGIDKEYYDKFINLAIEYKDVEEQKSKNKPVN